MENFKIKGFKDIEAVLHKMPKKIKRNVLNHAARKGANVILKEARRRAPKSKDRRSGKHLKALLKVGQRIAKRKLPPGEFVVGVLSGQGNHAALMEFGTGPRYQKTTGRYTGQVAAQPFMRPAYDAKKYEAIKVIQAELLARLNKEVAKLV